MSALRTLGLAFLGLLSMSPQASAQRANRIALQLPDCLDASWRDELISSARVELLEDGAILTTLDKAHPRGDEIHVAVVVACDSDASEARIQLDRATNTDPLSRTVQLSDVPHPLRPRTLALALAELWRTSISRVPDANTPTPQAEAAARRKAGLADTSRPRESIADSRGESSKPASQPIAAPVSKPSTPTAATQRPDKTEQDTTPNREAESSAPRLSLAPALRLYFAARDALPGAQLALSWRSWRIGAEGYYTSREDALGSARFGLIQGFLGWDLARIRFGTFGLTLGPRAAIGGILATAAPQGPAFATSATVVSWETSGEAAIWCDLTSHWALALRIQLGYAHGTILASDAGELARLHGLFATAALALELQLTDS